MDKFKKYVSVKFDIYLYIKDKKYIK